MKCKIVLSNGNIDVVFRSLDGYSCNDLEIRVNNECNILPCAENDIRCILSKYNKLGYRLKSLDCYDANIKLYDTKWNCFDNANIYIDDKNIIISQKLNDTNFTIFKRDDMIQVLSIDNAIIL